ncbi:MAG: HDIG domain-containing protein [Clostridia bacterium]|nr:HDIG domain-containing protein [Clostridia bacterium]
MMQPAVKRDKPYYRLAVFRFFLHPYFADSVIAVAVFAILFVLVFTAVSPERYELKAGDIPSEPIAAPRDVEDTYATEARIEQARNQVNDIYTLDQTITESVVAETEDIFTGIETVRGKSAEKLAQWEESQRQLQEQLEKQQREQEESSSSESSEGETTEQPSGMGSEVEEPAGSPTDPQNDINSEPDYSQLYDSAFISEMQAILPIQLSTDDIQTIITAEQRDLNQLHQYLIDTLRKMMGAGIKQEQIAEFKANLRDSIQEKAFPNELKLLGTNIGVPRLKANLLYDPDKTAVEKQKAAEAVDKVMFKKGQFIVQAGQPVTEVQIEMLSELGLIQDHKADIPLLVGTFLSVLIAMSFAVIYFVNFDRELLHNPLLILLIGVILCLVTGLSYVTTMFNPYLVPSSMAGILLTILISARVGVAMNITMSLLASLVSGMQIPIAALTLIGGMICISMLKSVQQRSTLVWTGMGVAAGNFITVFAYEMMSQGNWLSSLYSSLWGLLGGLLAAVLTIGTLPIWENLFHVVTPIKLVELGNPNQPVLKRLLMETPGTYHHSIIVANLAESAADAIGANGLLARVGAYYHDIGKLERPYYFKENQLSTDNPHDRLQPELSTRIITSHTSDGLELAKKHKVPAIVQNFILEHHGTSPVIYFYHKAKEENSESILEEFRYSGPRPRSRETAIVMMADISEAAVRAMTDHKPEKIEALIRKLIREKLDDGQFDECNISIGDMNTIAITFTNVISGIFHERVKYPAIDLKAERDKAADDLANR